MSTARILLRDTVRRILRVTALPRMWVAFCCLLAFTSSFNLTILVDVLYENLPHLQVRIHFSEVESDIDEDVDMFHSSLDRKASRRGESKYAADRGHAAYRSVRLPTYPCQLDATLRNAAPALFEHAYRNGVGVPLLC